MIKCCIAIEQKLNHKFPHPAPLKFCWLTTRNLRVRKLQQMLSPKANLQVVGTASDGKSTIACLETLKPDVVLIDLEMPRINGIETASIVARRFPECQILVLSSYEDSEYVQKAIDAGVDG